VEKDYLILKRASASRPSGEWNEDDFDVLAEGAVVGRPTPAAKLHLLTPFFRVRASEANPPPPRRNLPRAGRTAGIPVAAKVFNKLSLRITPLGSMP
jgi:hypothetical protein